MLRYLIPIATFAMLALVSLRSPSGAGEATAPGSAVADSLAFEEARAAATALGKTLMKELLAALEKGGPPAAIAVCADSAQVLTSRLGSGTLTVRRVSRKPRNPANAPDSLESTWLEYLELKAKEGNLPPEMTAKHITMNPGGSAAGTREILFMRPITIAEPCLKCHGDPATISPEVKKVLAERYPKDQAVGYAVGDFRGGISVRVRIPAEP